MTIEELREQCYQQRYLMAYISSPSADSIGLSDANLEKVGPFFKEINRIEDLLNANPYLSDEEISALSDAFDSIFNNFYDAIPQEQLSILFAQLEKFVN